MSSLAQTTTTRLREKILAGELNSGAPITEALVSKMLGVGRGPAREALLRLEAERLIRCDGPHKPRYIQFLEDLEPESMEQQLEVLGVLNGLAARRAALHLSGARILRLKELCRELKAAIKRGDPAARGAADREIHAIIRKETGNPLIMKALDACAILPVGTKEPATEKALSADRRWISERIAATEAAVEAIAAHDPDAAEAAERRLARATAEAFQRWMSRKRPQPTGNRS
ncbi:MAG TPA: GntR family transcriptional regulator [Planctomycetota bacterium]|jgi:DNA-binding GntR family transcriptional regulator|nr:GntR family transcriptional regulator [Planctomycetota bacterium]